MLNVAARGLTMVLELLLPERMNEIALCVIRCMLDQGCVSSFLANLRVSLAERIQSLFFIRLYNQRIDVNWSAWCVSHMFQR